MVSPQNRTAASKGLKRKLTKPLKNERTPLRTKLPLLYVGHDHRTPLRAESTAVLSTAVSSFGLNIRRVLWESGQARSQTAVSSFGLNVLLSV